MTPLSPKARFLQDETAAKVHDATMAGVTFEKAADAAMLQTQLNLPHPMIPEHAAANHHRMEGARLFLAILMTLADKPKDQTESAPEALKYDIK